MLLKFDRLQLVFWIATLGLLTIDYSAARCWAQRPDPFGTPTDEITGAQPQGARARQPASVLVMTPAPMLARRQPMAGTDNPAAASMESLENSLNAIVKVAFIEEPLK